LLRDKCADCGEFLFLLCAEGYIPRIRVRVGTRQEDEKKG